TLRRAGHVTQPSSVCLSVCPPGPVASSLHSSRVLAGSLGGSITHQCFYTPTPANQHQRKYWCKISANGPCSTIISSSFTSSHYQGRVALRDVPQNGTFTVTMTGLRSSDSGTYRCGIGSTNRGLYTSLTLAVWAGRVLSGLLGELWGQVLQLFAVSQSCICGVPGQRNDESDSMFSEG
uniref:Uncharacterized protein n=1 Tax=Geospiza parvula TaxID=87175 RepID=A0A8C3MQ89_GEOPR